MATHFVFQSARGTPARRGWLAFGTLIACTAILVTACAVRIKQYQDEQRRQRVTEARPAQAYLRSAE